ncbi:MAG: hypothetical protein ABL907_00260 [Hyphomicrobium sp.]
MIALMGVGDGTILIAMGLTALAFIGIYLKWQSTTVLGGGALVASVIFPELIGAISFENSLSNTAILLGLLVPGFLLAFALAIALQYFFPTHLSSRRAAATLTILAILNCGWLAFFTTNMAQAERSIAPLLKKLNCPPIQRQTTPVLPLQKNPP